MIRLLYQLARESGVSRAAQFRLSALAIFSSLLAALPPHFLGAIVNAATGGVHRPTAYSPIALFEPLFGAAADFMPDSPILVFGLLFFLCSCFAVVMRNLFVVHVEYYAKRFIAHIRKKSLAAVLYAERKESSRWASGEVVHRIMNDTGQMEYLVGVPLYVLCSDIFDLLCVSFFILLLDWKILCVLLSIFPVLYILGHKTGRRHRKLAKTAQETEAECTGFVQQVFAGLDTIKVFEAEDKEYRNFARRMDFVANLGFKSSINLGTFFCLEGALRTAGTIIVIAYAAFLATKDIAYAGTIPVLIIYTQRFYSPLSNWTRFYQVIQKSIVSFNRIHELMALAPEPERPSGELENSSVFPLVIDGAVRLEQERLVSLCTGLEKPGLVILRGKSGVGKTRFTKALLSLGDTFQGEVKAGKNHFCGANIHAARPLFAHASQDGYFLPGTVAENLAYPDEGEAIDRKRCQELLTSLDLRDFSLDDTVHEYGKNLSLGEGRRIVLGRALYARRPILVLDEIDANVDMETRKRIYSLIAAEKEKRPVFLITHINALELREIEHTVVAVGEGGCPGPLPDKKEQSALIRPGLLTL